MHSVIFYALFPPLTKVTAQFFRRVVEFLFAAIKSEIIDEKRSPIKDTSSIK
jgi:hypothetical protein